MEDRIEHRITIRSTQGKVWQLVSRPGWWLPGSESQPARGPGRVAVEYSGDARPYAIDVVRVEPQGYASFRWASAFGGANPAPGNATLVEFYLRPVGDEIGVTVVESGFSSLDLTDALREDAWKGNSGGWQYELAGLRTRAESSTESRDSVSPAESRGSASAVRASGTGSARASGTGAVFPAESRGSASAVRASGAGAVFPAESRGFASAARASGTRYGV